jgi:hypothetical protein
VPLRCLIALCLLASFAPPAHAQALDPGTLVLRPAEVGIGFEPVRPSAPIELHAGAVQFTLLDVAFQREEHLAVRHGGPTFVSSRVLAADHPIPAAELAPFHDQLLRNLRAQDWDAQPVQGPLLGQESHWISARQDSEPAPVVSFAVAFWTPSALVMVQTAGAAAYTSLAHTEALSRLVAQRIPDAARMIPSGDSLADGSEPFTDTRLRSAWGTLVDIPRATERQRVGEVFATLRERTGVEIQVGELPDRVYADFRASPPAIIVNASYLNEDHRDLAAVIAHELTHAVQWSAGAGSRGDCIAWEVEAHQVEALAWFSLWEGQTLPTRTPLERDLTANVEVLRTQGEAGLAARLAQNPGYQAQCAHWDP